MNRKLHINPFKAIALIFATALVCFFQHISFSQTNDTNLTQANHELPEFSVSEKMNVFYSKINTHRIDSNLLAINNTNSLSTLLNRHSGVNILSYGVTGISSVAMRGGNANHTAVLWNGFNIQDPLYGGYNFSSSSVNFTDDIYIQYGGGSSAYGSGAIGGTIHLNNTPLYNKGIFGSTQYKYGSFGLNSFNIDAGYSSDRFSTKMRLFKHNINNDFKFENKTKANSPTENYENASITQQGLLHEIYYKLKKNTFSSQFWYQHNYREVPASITSFTESIEEYQVDNWYRWALHWIKEGDKVNYLIRTGTFYNQSNYVNSSIDLDVNNNSLKNTTEGLIKLHLIKNNSTTVGVINNYTMGLSDNYGTNPTLNNTAFYLAPSFTILKKIKLNVNVREEIAAQQLKPITYSINSKYNFYRNLFLTTSFSKNYRTPNFNDLFWQSGFASGNKNLLDEYGYSKDVGLMFKKVTQKTSIKSSISFYQNKINQQIQWVAEGQSWTPRNIKLVETQGVEYFLSSSFQLNKKLQLHFHLTYTYTDAQTKEKAPNESDDILNKQLIYTPYYQANSSIGVQYKALSFHLNPQYTGYQFTRADNLDWIDSFILTNISMQYNLRIKKNALVFSGQANNIFNVEYEVRQWYPMPKMNFEIGIKAIFN